MKITYNISNSKNEVFPIAIVTLNERKEFESIETPAGFNNILNFFDDDAPISTNDGYSLPGIKTIKDLKLLITPPRCVTVHSIFKTDSNNLGSPDNWDLLAGTISADRVEQFILDFHKKHGTNTENFYPVVTVIQVK